MMTLWYSPFGRLPDSTVSEPAAPKLSLLKLPSGLLADPVATKASAMGVVV